MKVKFFILIFLISSFFLISQKGTVLENTAKRASLIQNCQNVVDSAREDCWLKATESLVSKSGSSPGFLLVSDLYKSEKDFGKYCHALVHRIGETTYINFSKGRQFDLTADASLCDFGFYHGFMEFLVAKGGSLSEARAFCDSIEKKSKDGKISPNSVWSCYHGIGHGTFETHKPNIWGNLDKMLGPSLQLCDKVADTPRKLEICYTGSFNALQIAFVNNLYKLSMDEKDPLALCVKYNELAKSACYPEMAFAHMIKKKLDFDQSVEFIKSIKGQSYQTNALYNFSSQVLGRKATAKNDFSLELENCNKLSSNLRLVCIKGVAYGLFAYADPLLVNAKITKLCKSNLLDSAGKTACYEQIRDYIYSAYPYKTAASFCKTVVRQNITCL